jgi:hypothetical protein
MKIIKICFYLPPLLQRLLLQQCTLQFLTLFPACVQSRLQVLAAEQPATTTPCPFLVSTALA